MKSIEEKFEDVSYKYLTDDKKRHTLLFLHGFTGNSSIWDFYIEELKNSFDIISIDLVGHGKSESPKVIEEYLLHNQAKKIVNLLNKLEIKSFSIICCSFSCYIGLLINKKEKEKVKAMIFISPWFKKKKLFFENLISKSIQILWKSLIPNKKFFLDYSKLNNYENPTLTDVRFILKCINTKDFLGSVYSSINCDDILKFDNLEIPLLIIHGENDKTFSNEIKAFFTKFKLIETKIIKTKKHLFLKTENETVLEFIKSFMKENPDF